MFRRSSRLPDSAFQEGVPCRPASSLGISEQTNECEGPVGPRRPSRGGHSADLRFDDPRGLCEVMWRRGYFSGTFVAVQGGEASEEIGKSPRFRWRKPSFAPPETPEVVSCLATLEEELAGWGWELIDTVRDHWCALQFRRCTVPLTERLNPYVVEPDTAVRGWISKGAAARARSTDPETFSSPPSELEPEPSKAHEPMQEGGGQREAERQETERLEAKRLEEQRREAERLEAERHEAERREAQRLEKQRREAERLEAQRLEEERREAERREAERAEAERAEAERAEAERSGGGSLQHRLSTYSAKSDLQGEIRMLFQQKKLTRREHRFRADRHRRS